MKTLLINTIAFNFFTSIVFAQEGGGSQTVVTDTIQPDISVLTVTVESNFTNSYLWRGIEFNRGLILQPSVNFEYDGFTLNIWNNSTLIESNGNVVSQEIDYTISDAIEAGNFYFEPALMFYTYLSGKSISVTSEASLFAGYYLGDFGIYINPSSVFLLNVGSVFSEQGFTYDHKTDKSHIVLNAGYGTGNKKFADYNILGDESVTPHSVYKLIDINGYMKKNLNETIFIKPSFNYFRIISSDYTNFLNTNQLSIAVSIGAEF